ncbi:hypothetical protein [Thermoflexus sp.]|uniref:hypothetical protein n=1 Tax=Thermoflexus sp. TaxID=1969742 RepID=UPI0025EDE8B2|nr:hypothetical protein [Thermoflexus sp.]MCS6962909.1 hypothetical protein [Thermoflexus sp.]MCS7351124.1 hypothetical protein [Thermoflexus sp.]MCX7689895.1 hypothetical protein [Thermoflexus sp.]MDW8180577.1 hypothetical protein [Anaerolineae bacterium]
MGTPAVTVTRSYGTPAGFRPWWRRRHRDVYRVRVAGEAIFELHFHRGPGRRYWVLYTVEGLE